MKTAILANVFLFALFASPALADSSEANACADKLSDPAQLIFHAVTPKLKPGVNAIDVVRSTVEDMVKSGKIKRSEARSDAQAAGVCLKKLQD